MVSLVADNIKPDWWAGENKVCYRLLSKIFDVSSRCEGSQGEVVKRALLCLFSYHELKEGKVKLVAVTVDDFLGKKVSQRFEDKAQQHSWWEEGRVLNVVQQSDTNNPEFVVEFDCQEELQIDENTAEDVSAEDISADCEVCSFCLFEDYLNNDLRFL